MKTSLSFACAAALAVFGGGCKPKAETKAASAPAKVVTENDLTTIVLKPEAEQRLGIATAPATLQAIGRTRMLGGELLVPLGRAAEPSSTGAAAKSIYSLLPAMSPSELVRVAEMQVDTDGAVAAAEVRAETAKLALARAENLVASSSGTQRALDEARAEVKLAEAALRTARERRALLGTPLFETVQKDLLWVRVPIYAGDLDRIHGAAAALVTSLGQRSNAAARPARPLNIPFASATASATVDLYYEVENADGGFRPGQKVSVAVPLAGDQQSVVVPAAAVLYDIHGGAWVYEHTAPQTFTRRRVEVRYVADAGAVLARGPAAGAKIVTTGAAELFGTEFGTGK